MLHGLRPRPVDGPAAFAGLSHPGRRLDRRQGRPSRRCHRAAVAPPHRRGGSRRQLRPSLGPLRRRRRRRAARLDRLGPRAEAIDPSRAASPRPPGGPPAGPAPRRSPTGTPPTCAPSTPTVSGSRSPSPTLLTSAPTWWPARPASSSTIAVSASASSPAIPPSTARAGARPTRSLRHSSPVPTARWPRSSERWAATSSRRSSCSCWPACCTRGRTPPPPSPPPRVVHEAPGAPPFRLWQAPAQSCSWRRNAPEGWRRGLEASRSPGAGRGCVQPGRRRMLADHLRRAPPTVTSCSPVRPIPAAPTARLWAD